MTQRLTCLACGLESNDVAPTIVEYPDPIEVTVHVPVSARRNAIEMPRQVPGVYGAEWRCRDVVACRQRAEAMQGRPEPPRDAATDVSDVARVEPPSEPEGSWFS
jgi:hypothetical protein